MMEDTTQQHLITQAKEILLANRRAGFTIPRDKLYPFQWNWDSGFVCLGYQYFKPEFVIQEFRSLFSGQWENGMLPHIIFHSETENTYFPNWDFWDSNRNSGAPIQPKTSGITQPPVHGFILERIFNRNPRNLMVRSFIQEIFLKIVKLHRWFYTYRDPHKEGLIYIFHPWESGRDNSPLWDDILQKITFTADKIPAYTRRDTQIADASERPLQRDYDRYVYLLELGKEHAYEGPGISDNSPFLVQDTLMNAVLIKSNESLINLGKELGFDTSEIETWQAKSIKRFNEKLWNEELGLFTAYDLRNEEQITHREIGGFTAMYANIANQEQAERMHSCLQSWIDQGYLLCPSFDTESPLFDSKRYWRGPIWPQMNWLVYHGLKNYGFTETADIVRSNLMDLVEKHGFYEYFEAKKELLTQLDHGYGGSRFSWTSAVFLDLIYSA